MVHISCANLCFNLELNFLIHYYSSLILLYPRRVNFFLLIHICSVHEAESDVFYSDALMLFVKITYYCYSIDLIFPKYYKPIFEKVRFKVINLFDWTPWKFVKKSSNWWFICLFWFYIYFVFWFFVSLFVCLFIRLFFVVVVFIAQGISFSR